MGILGAMKSGDAPEIRKMERWGTAAPEAQPRCPVCGAECNWLYVDGDGQTVGCESCLTRRDAWTVWEEICGGNR